ncbi:hypothetical protein [Patiriisocius hiemis]|uniref:Uncharacterized protein n=1 Tax=Patiriisocius hiemis TaxID=3075604 RepID=A0ABU2YE48_9FLAO|nr:hypothetical protein [Constantimarinum sp. W242]MDT0556136.1 hypothetical protein [Constantimarinum sp. W242]
MKISITVILLLGIVTSCCSGKKDMANGFTIGTIVYSVDENDCNYTIKVTNKNEEVFYDPINLEDDFKKNDIKIAFKFRPLKMKNRCNKANPISVFEVKKK